MALANAGSECVRLRYVHNAEIAGSDINNCGVYDFRFNAGGNNGEGVYIGTSPGPQQDARDADQSGFNWVHDIGSLQRQRIHRS